MVTTPHAQVFHERAERRRSTHLLLVRRAALLFTLFLTLDGSLLVADGIAIGREMIMNPGDPMSAVTVQPGWLSTLAVCAVTSVLVFTVRDARLRLARACAVVAVATPIVHWCHDEAVEGATYGPDGIMHMWTIFLPSDVLAQMSTLALWSSPLLALVCAVIWFRVRVLGAPALSKP